MRLVDYRPGELPDLATKISMSWRALKQRRLSAIHAGRLVLPGLTDAGMAALLNDLERLCAGRGLLPSKASTSTPKLSSGAQGEAGTRSARHHQPVLQSRVHGTGEA